MRAVLCQAFGKPDELRLADIPPRPAPQAGEVVIDVVAAGVNFADILMVSGQYQEKPALPFTPGLEAAGIVHACGSGVTRVRPGDRVIALFDRGGYAEQATARETDVFLMPDGMDFAAAAGFAIAYGTSHGALRWRADLKAGEMLLVHGAAGGVGLTAVEIGKAMGATVIATAGDRDKLAVAAAHGADHLIDYRTESIRDRVKEICNGGGVDVVYDPVGGSAFEASLRSVNWGARLVIVGFAGGQVPQIPANILLVKNIAALGLYWGSYRRHRPQALAAA
ncbi:MAG TPA: NADPH:quinone oxidoreductase family protein, partial [Dongiaceae bacterium]|nr:NADPH:quinone oxidoreductase family protein [Dongiaceae bacterium]